MLGVVCLTSSLPAVRESEIISLHLPLFSAFLALVVDQRVIRLLSTFFLISSAHFPIVGPKTPFSLDPASAPPTLALRDRVCCFDSLFFDPKTSFVSLII